MAATRNRQICPQDTCRGCSEETRGCLQEFGEATSLHGVHFITGQRGHLCERLCWTVAILVSAVLCCREITKLYIRWQDSPVITSFARYSTPVSDVPFPAVTICPESKVLRSVMDVEEKFDWLWNQLNGTIEFETEAEKLQAETISIICNSDPNLPLDFTHTKKHNLFIPKISPSLNDVFQKCSFESKEYKCSALFRPIITEDGLCFTFNMLPSEDIFYDNYDGLELQSKEEYIKTSERSWTLENGYAKDVEELADDESDYPWRQKIYLGPLSGLEIFLKMHKGDSQHACSNNNADNFKVTLHSAVEYPLPVLNYFHVSPNTQSMVSVLPERIDADDTLHPPHYKPEIRGCVFPEENIGLLFKNLTEHNCLLDVKTRAAIEKCNCTFFDTPIKGTGNHSLNYCNDRECSISPKIAKKCLPSCHELRYTYHVSNSKFEWVKMTNETVYEDYQFTKINIFYDRGTFFAVRKSERYGITDFMANCGGLLGLFTGFSVITAIEICYFASLRIFCRLHERRKVIRADVEDTETRA